MPFICPRVWSSRTQRNCLVCQRATWTLIRSIVNNSRSAELFAALEYVSAAVIGRGSGMY